MYTYTKEVVDSMKKGQLKEKRKQELKDIVNELVNVEKMPRKDLCLILGIDNWSLWRVIKWEQSMSLNKVEGYIIRLIESKCIKKG